MTIETRHDKTNLAAG